jgi:putative oxidoreductase
MKILTIILRTLLGLLFVVFGSNAFLQFMPMPPMSGPSGDFIHALAGTGYLQVIAALQVLGGLFLVIGKFVPLGLTILGPIIVNIVLFHIFLDRQGLGMAAGITVVFLFLVWVYRSAFAGLLRAGSPLNPPV